MHIQEKEGKLIHHLFLMCSNNARCVKERGASGVPNEEFDWIIFEKKSSMGDRISSVKAIGSGSWR